MTNSLVVRNGQSFNKHNCAAQYVRMSTDMQQYSIQNQAAAIAAYAHAHELQIVRTYADRGESGLRIKNRSGLQQLLADVCNGEADFSHILVFDVSRWGRFQDIDESAHYEFICRQAGIKVRYCAEQFDNDGSMLSSIVKNLKRVMAAEYSRDLSVKVFAGQARQVRQGFHQGGPTNYGLQRELIDDHFTVKGILRKGEHKSIRTDHIKIRPGTEYEIGVVRLIFQECLKRKSSRRIARELNEQAVSTGTGRPWNSTLVSRVLRNENYIGNLIFNRYSRKLGASQTANPPEEWVRGERSIDPIIDTDVFRRVQHIMENKQVRISQDEMLVRLRRTLQKKGRLSCRIIDQARDLPSSDVYCDRFGSLENVYRLVGYDAKANFDQLNKKMAWGQLTSNFMQETSAILTKNGRQVDLNCTDNQLCVDAKETIF